MRRPVWAVICGMPRFSFEFYTTISCLCDMRSRGVIEGIVFSTWTGEPDALPDLRHKLEALDVVIVETEPLEDPTAYANIVYLRQATQLYRALYVLPEDALVLKCRTDYSNFDLNRMDLLHAPDLAERLKNRVAVLRYGISAPFSFHDISFVGDLKALRRMLVLDNAALKYTASVIPDLWFFAGRYAAEYPVVDAFFRYIEPMRFRLLLNEMEIADEDAFYLPGFLNRFYGRYFAIIQRDFLLYHDVEVEEDTPISLADVFLGKASPGVRKDWCVEVRSQHVMDRLTTGSVEYTRGYGALISQIWRAMDIETDAGMSFEEYEELSDWGRNVLHAKPEEWLRPFVGSRRSEHDTKGMTGFDEAAKLLFSSYEVDDAAYSAIRDVTFQKKSYYDTVIAHLDTLKNSDYELYKQALFSATRYFNDQVLRRVSELLITEDLSDYEVREACYVFERFAGDARLYSEPVTSERLDALYNFAVYKGFTGEKIYERIKEYLCDGE